MKVYGIDLQKQYNKILQDEISIISRIKKRRNLLIKKTPSDVLKRSGRIFNDNDDVQKMLDDIIIIEKTYVDQAKQLDLFDTK